MDGKPLFNAGRTIFPYRYGRRMNEEIKGFADETGIEPRKVVFYYSYFQPSGHCTQAVYRTGGRTCHMRNYDFGFSQPLYPSIHAGS